MRSNSDSKSSESGGNGKRKIPKRGPGVAKLEEMRRKDEEQKRHNQYPPHTMNQLLAGSISATPNSSSSLPFGLKNPIEPPSNQSSYHHNYTSQPPQEHRIQTIGTKRPYTSTLEISLVPPTHSQASPFPSSLFGRLLQPSTNDAHTASSFPSTNDCRRDANWGTPLGLNTRKFNSDNAGTCHYNFPPFASPSVPPPPTHDHDVIEERKSESSGYDHHNKPFYNFMEVEDPEDLKETGHGSNHDGGGDAIDLKLKL